MAYRGAMRWILAAALATGCARTSGGADAALDADVAYLEGQQKFMAGDFPAAAEAYRRAIALEPKRVQAHHALGESLLVQGKYAEAGAAYARATVLDPQKKAAWLRLGKANSAAGKADEALEAYARARTLDPGDPAVWRQGAELEAAVGRIDEGVGSLERAAVLDAAGAAGDYVRAAEMRQMTGDLAGAAALLVKAAQAAPKDGATWAKLGDLQVKRGEYASAVTSFAHAAEASPDDPMLPETLAELYVKLGRSADAEQAYARSLSLKARASPYLGLARVHHARGDGAAARAALRKAFDVASGEDLVETRDLAATAAIVGAHDHAVRLYEVLVKEPDASRDASLWAALARSQKALGRSGNAGESCRRARALKPESACP